VRKDGIQYRSCVLGKVGDKLAEFSVKICNKKQRLLFEDGEARGVNRSDGIRRLEHPGHHGCLGLDLGFHAAGFRCLSLNENDRHAQQTIVQNLHLLGEPPPLLYRESMLDLTPARIMNDLGIVPGEVDAMVGGPPCQSFSGAGKRGGLADPRGHRDGCAAAMSSTW
jgi:hypothetical protein